MLAKTRIQILIVIGIALITLFVGLGRRQLWNPVEPRYAAITTEMLRTGQWLVPTYNGETYDQKPALFFWLCGGLAAGEGKPEQHFWLRVPSAVGGLLMALFTLLLGRRLYPGYAGLIGAVLLLTMWLPFWSSRFLHLDTLMGAASTAAVLATEIARDGGRRRLIAIAGGGLAMGAGLLLKGPAVILFPAMVVIGRMMVERDVRIFRRSGLHWQILIGIALAACWFLPAWRNAGDEWARELLVGQGVMRLLDDSVSQKHGAFYYLWVMFGSAAPWSPMVPFAIACLLRGRRKSGDGDSTLVLLFWIAAVFIVLNLGASSRTRYLMTLIPALALILGRFLDRDILGTAHPNRLALYPVCTVAFLFGLVELVSGAFFLFGKSIADQLPFEDLSAVVRQFDDTGLLGNIGGAIAMAGAIVTLAAALRMRAAVAIGACHATLVACCFFWGMVGAPALDAWRGDVALYETLEAEAEDRVVLLLGPWAGRESTRGLIGFHLGRTVLKHHEGGDAAARMIENRRTLILVRREDVERGRSTVPPGFARINAKPLSKWGVDVYRNTTRQ